MISRLDLLRQSADTPGDQEGQTLREEWNERQRQLAFGAAAGWAALGIAGGLLLGRSVGGAFSQSLPEALILLVMIVVSLGSLALQGVVRWSDPSRQVPGWSELCAIGMPILWGTPLLSHSGGFAIGAVFSLWLIQSVGVLCVAWWSTAEVDSQTGFATPVDTEATTAVSPQVLEEPHSSTDEKVEEFEESWPFGEDVDQWQTRSRWDGGLAVSGGVLVEFPPGARDTVVHLTFCPALPETPELTAEELDGHGWDIKVAASLAWGGRLTVRRRGPADEAVCGRIGYSAVCTSSAEAA